MHPPNIGGYLMFLLSVEKTRIAPDGKVPRRPAHPDALARSTTVHHPREERAGLVQGTGRG